MSGNLIAGSGLLDSGIQDGDDFWRQEEGFDLLGKVQDLESHPKLGASWEGFVISQVIRQLGARAEECYFWGTHAGSELDLLVVRGRIRLGFEVKRTSSPRLTPSLRNAQRDLKLNSLDIVHAGDKIFSLAKGIRAVAFSRLLEDVMPVR